MIEDNDDRPHDEPDVNERSIAQVGAQSRQTNTLVVVFGLGIVGLLLWFVNQGTQPDTIVRLTTPEPLTFDTPSRRDPPRIPDPEPKPVPTNSAAQAAMPDPMQAELQRIALRRAEEERQLMQQRRRAPILVVNKLNGRGSGAGLLSAPAVNATSKSVDSLAVELSSSEVDTVGASLIENKGSIVAQGSLIRGVLETAIQSDLPGFVRAEVAHDVYSFDGSRLLIPKASRLVGHYRSGLVRGQTRVFVIWDRLLRPDGASILIGSPSTDLLGRAGLDGDLDTHFFKIFGASILLSLVDGAIDVAVENARGSSGSGTTILQNTNQLTRAAETALENSINIPPTIHVDQGTAIQVFVARDLDFRNVTNR